MNHIYDILVNFQHELYDMYEWNKEDSIYHIRKVPLFKLNSKVLNELINNKVILEYNFLEKLYRRTELFTRNKIATLDYCFLASDGKQVVAFKLNKEGSITDFSKLLIEEELEVLEYVESLNEYSLSYKLFNNLNLIEYKTRKEQSIKNYIFKELKTIIKSNNEEMLKYLYLDCFDEKEDIEYIYKNIFKDIEKCWDDVYLKIYHFLKLVISKR